MINPYYFRDRSLKVGFDKTLESHHVIHAHSKSILKTNYTEFWIEVRFINKIIKKLSAFMLD